MNDRTNLAPLHWPPTRSALAMLLLSGCCALGGCSGGDSPHDGAPQAGSEAAAGSGGASAPQPIASGPASTDCPASGASSTAPSSSMHCAP